MRWLGLLACLGATGMMVCGCGAGAIQAPKTVEVAPTKPIPKDARRVHLQVVTGSAYGVSVRTAHVVVEDDGVRVQLGDGAERRVSVQQWHEAREILNTGLGAATPRGSTGCYRPDMDCTFQVSSDGESRTGCCLSPLGLALEEGAELLAQVR